MQEHPDHDGGCPISRRRFLGSVGAAGLAGAAAAGLGQAFVADGAAAAVSTSPQRFGRLFPALPSFADPSAATTRALLSLGAPAGPMDARDKLSAGPVRLITDPSLSTVNRDNPNHTAGVTFLGQFLAHDITFDASSTLGQPQDPSTVTNERSPSLDLDSVYGKGPTVHPALYDATDTAKLKVGFGGRFEDLPRDATGRAILGDPRNDEHLILAGLHAAFLLFHNRVVDLIRASRPGLPAATVFAQARTTVTWHYQWIILHEFLPLIVGQALIDNILAGGRTFYTPAAGKAFIPVEFQGAAFRFGHSMVRPSYRANLAGNADGSPFFGLIFDPSQEGRADPDDLRGGIRAPRRFVGWQTFFDFGDGQARHNKRIDTRLSTPLFQLPLSAIADGSRPTALAQRTLLRHITWSMPSGQDIAAAMGVTRLAKKDFGELKGAGLDSSTPLWYYLLKEAELLADGSRLGPVGGRIVAEVLIGLLQLDSTSHLSAQRSWRPTLPSATPGVFTMTDLLRLARVDPASRGQ